MTKEPESVGSIAAGELVQAGVPGGFTGFSADVFRLGSGAAGAQLVTIAAAPILTRIYAPEVFGVLTEFVAIASVLGVIACFRYELSIVLPADDDEASNLFVVSLAGALASTILVGLGAFIFAEVTAGWLAMPELVPVAWMIPLSVAAGGSMLAFNYWCSRQQRFGVLAIGRFSGAVLTTAIRVGVGAVGFATAFVMIGAHVAGQILTVALLALATLRSDTAAFRRNVSLKAMAAGIGRYRRFPLFNTWSALLNTVSWYLPTILLGFYFSLDVVGYYGFGFRILQMPMYTVGIAVSQVFFQRAARARREGNLGPLVESVFERLVIIGLFPMLMLTLVGRELYAVVFGTEWAEAGTYTEILAVWAFFWFVSSPLSTLISVLERQRFGLWFNTLLFVSRFAVLVVGGRTGNARLTLLLLAVSGTLIYIYLTMDLMASAGVSPFRVARTVAWQAVYWLPFGAVQWTAGELLGSPAAVVSVAAALTIVHGAFLWKRHGLALFRNTGSALS